mmetsp:Transcript_2272/g.5152  ORF Transcript_2272/g.5152 Transcript_2272/m.5152 type:complete len:203 (+) Transcript_2272:726-1334(+)
MWTPRPATSVHSSTAFLPDLSAESASSRSNWESCPCSVAESAPERFRNCEMACMLLIVLMKTSTRGFCRALPVPGAARSASAAPRPRRTAPMSCSTRRSAGRRPPSHRTKRCSTDAGGRETPLSSSLHGIAAGAATFSAIVARPAPAPSPGASRFAAAGCCAMMRTGEESHPAAASSRVSEKVAEKSSVCRSGRICPTMSLT